MSLSAWTTKFSWQTFGKIILLIAVLIAVNFLARSVTDTLDFQVRVGNEDVVHKTIMVSAALYSVLLAIPFVPGAEIGLGLIAMLGPPIVFLVYLCTVAGLTLSFVVGRLIPMSVLIRLSKDFHLQRLSALLSSIEPLSRQEILAFLAAKAPNRYLPLLLRHRYIALAVAINVPGNFLIGGGGGIALFAGVSRLYSIPGFLVTIAIAVAPIPIAVLIIGKEFLAN